MAPIFGSDGRAMSPTHARGRRGQQYRYYVSQSVLKGSAADGPAIARISAAEIEGAVIAQVRGLLRQPEVVLGAWRAARASAPDMTEDEARLALERLDPLGQGLIDRGFNVAGRETRGEFNNRSFEEQVDQIATDLESHFWRSCACVVANSYGAYLFLHAQAHPPVTKALNPSDDLHQSLRP